ncbi:unnamed protein product [Vitrella brassicaformis CCMP3155]|uniref:Uncharacterized protein n=1 Tax=Vitrella brassicaformis (strain CCMP3155) TaxID=1169540 RepID=A0A0G4FN91_VITBC|nr:unnamed protein product [Vitrella brassicaformis CCMP3155]|eukprot:CEM15715.1 unnamed protein product [Vitrella brassicaformis CCMP3155]
MNDLNRSHGVNAPTTPTDWRDRRYPLSVPLALEVLKRDFKASKNHQKKIDKLCETYDRFRRVRGDGAATKRVMGRGVDCLCVVCCLCGARNCFYRALGFALLELRETAAYDFDIPADVLADDDLAVQYGRLQSLSGSELYWQLMTDADLDLAIVKMLRRLVRKYMLEHADESVTPGEEGVLTISEYVSTYPIPATSSPSPSTGDASSPADSPTPHEACGGKSISSGATQQQGQQGQAAEEEFFQSVEQYVEMEAEGGLVFAVASIVLNDKIHIVQLDNTDALCPLYEYREGSVMMPGTTPVVLLFRPGHYDLLYATSQTRPFKEMSALQAECSDCGARTSLRALDMLICFHRLCVTCKKRLGRKEHESVDGLECPVCFHSPAGGAGGNGTGQKTMQCPICTCREELNTRVFVTECPICRHNDLYAYFTAAFDSQSPTPPLTGPSGGRTVSPAGPLMSRPSPPPVSPPSGTDNFPPLDTSSRPPKRSTRPQLPPRPSPPKGPPAPPAKPETPPTTNRGKPAPPAPAKRPDVPPTQKKEREVSLPRSIDNPVVPSSPSSAVDKDTEDITSPLDDSTDIAAPAAAGDTTPLPAPTVRPSKPSTVPPPAPAAPTPAAAPLSPPPVHAKAPSTSTPTTEKEETAERAPGKKKAKNKGKKDTGKAVYDRIQAALARMEKGDEGKNKTHAPPKKAGGGHRPLTEKEEERSRIKEKQREEQERKRQEEEEEQKRREQREEEQKRREEQESTRASVERMSKLAGLVSRCLTDELTAEKLANETHQLLQESDWHQVLPSATIAEELLKAIDAGVADESLESPEAVSALVAKIKPTLENIFQTSCIHRHKLRFLFAIQKGTLELRHVRISPSWALVEAVFDALYTQDIIEEQYFTWWREHEQDKTPGKQETLSQVVNWLDWLKTAPCEGDPRAAEINEDVAEGDPLAAELPTHSATCSGEIESPGPWSFVQRGTSCQCVVLSSCDSRAVASAFLDAGALHVADTAARKFAYAFYHSLLVGNSINWLVRHSAEIPSPHQESNKFVLLPAAADHSEVLLSSLPTGLCVDWYKYVLPSATIAEELLKAIDAGVADESLESLEAVSALVAKIKPTLENIFQTSCIHRHKLRFLFAIQKGTLELRHVRISPLWALVEAVFDALYTQDIIEEQYFTWWREDEQDKTPGKQETLSQVVNWLDWLNTAPCEGDPRAAEINEDVAEGDPRAAELQADSLCDLFRSPGPWSFVQRGPSCQGVVLSSCNSRAIASASFLDAGALHVADTAARKFVYAFYDSLLVGNSINWLVRHSAEIPSPHQESNKFVLLPAAADHSEVLLSSLPTGLCVDWSQVLRCLSGITPIRSLVNIGGSIADLFRTPTQHMLETQQAPPQPVGPIAATPGTASGKRLIVFDNDLPEKCPLVPKHIHLGELDRTNSVRLLRQLCPNIDVESAARTGDLCGHLPLAVRVIGRLLGSRPDMTLERDSDHDLTLSPLSESAACVQPSVEALAEPLPLRQALTTLEGASTLLNEDSEHHHQLFESTINSYFVHTLIRIYLKKAPLPQQLSLRAEIRLYIAQVMWRAAHHYDLITKQQAHEQLYTASPAAIPGTASTTSPGASTGPSVDMVSVVLDERPNTSSDSGWGPNESRVDVRVMPLPITTDQNTFEFIAAFLEHGRMPQMVEKRASAGQESRPDVQAR